MIVSKSKISVAGLLVSPYTKSELLEVLADRLRAGAQTTIVTPYSEFLLAALRDRSKEELFNSFDIAVPDGVGIFYAERFLASTFSARSFYGRLYEAWLQAIVWLFRIILDRKSLYEKIPEKIVGADLIWDLSALAERLGYSIFLAGGYGKTSKRTAEVLQKRFPNLKIAGFSNKNFNDPALLDDVKQAKPDFVFAALGAVRQEAWIMENKDLGFKLAIGLGGTFDYAVGDKMRPPSLIRKIGLEWLFRLITQPRRFKRIYNATVSLIAYLVRYKVFMSFPYRLDAVAVIFNQNNEVLVCQRKHGPVHWQFPQGGLKSGESIIDAASREAYEETGLKELNFIGTSQKIHNYLWRNATRRVFWDVFHNKGQHQRLVYFKINPEFTSPKLDNREFKDFRWVKISDLQNILHEYRMPLALIIQSDLQEGQIKL